MEWQLKVLFFPYAASRQQEGKGRKNKKKEEKQKGREKKFSRRERKEDRNRKAVGQMIHDWLGLVGICWG